VGNAETISAIEQLRVKHMKEPKNQHQVTPAGPPVSMGVLKVDATDDVTPMMEKAKEIVGSGVSFRRVSTEEVTKQSFKIHSVPPHRQETVEPSKAEGCSMQCRFIEIFDR
jgi:hypothetical protein